MKHYKGTRFNSRWDKSTWLLLALVAACCVLQFYFDEGIWPFIISFVLLAFVLTTFLSIFYKIDGDELVVYTFFIPTAYPIAKIKEIKPTKCSLSAPATSLTHRLAITFTDRKILKSSMPLIISPSNQEEFIRKLLSINPEIEYC